MCPARAAAWQRIWLLARSFASCGRPFILSFLEGADRLFLTLLYGTGMRLMEGLRLRVKDVDLPRTRLRSGTAREGRTA